MKLAKLLTEPWALKEDTYGALLVAAQRGESVEDAKRSLVPSSFLLFLERDEKPSELEVRSGTALIPVNGVLTRKSYWRSDRASYEWIGARLSEALERGDVERIAFLIDSPGGQVSGAEELAQAIYDARGEKPMTAFALGTMASAAYWIGSAADEIRATRTALIGSIGVMWTFIDFSKMDEELGIREITIVSSQSPDKDIDPTTREGRAKIQATVDQLAGVFVADVARSRGVDESTVIEDFGRGWVLVGQEAVDAGSADRIGLLEEALAEMEGNPTGGPMSLPKTIATEKITAEWLAEHMPELADGLRSEGRTAAEKSGEPKLKAAQDEAATAKADAEKARGEAKAAEGKAGEATEAERKRILALLDLPAKGHEKLLREMIEDPSTEAAGRKVLEAEGAKGQAALDALRKTEPKDPPDPSGDDDEGGIASLIKAGGDYATAHLNR